MPEIDRSLPWLDFTSPFQLPLHMELLELSVFAAWILTIVHWYHHFRQGRTRPLLAWLAILAYGTILEIITYNTVDNFAHEQFSVMLYHHRLPLYICMVYQVVVYVAQQSAERLGLTPLMEAMAAGLLAVVMYTPYDLIGPTMPWWAWKPHLTTESRWLGVPYSSTLWMFLFHGVIAWLIRWGDGRRRPGAGSMMLWTLVIAILTLVVGFIVFLPYHGLRFLGLGDGWILLLFVVGGLICVIRAKPRPVAPDDRYLLCASLVWHLFFIAASLWAPQPILWVATPMILTSTGLTIWLHRRPTELIPSSGASDAPSA